MVEPPFSDTPYGKYLENSKNMYERAVKAFPSPDPPDEYVFSFNIFSMNNVISDNCL